MVQIDGKHVIVEDADQILRYLRMLCAEENHLRGTSILSGKLESRPGRSFGEGLFYQAGQGSNSRSLELYRGCMVKLAPENQYTNNF